MAARMMVQTVPVSTTLSSGGVRSNARRTAARTLVAPHHVESPSLEYSSAGLSNAS